jgi:hypothetical protein
VQASDTSRKLLQRWLSVPLLLLLLLLLPQVVHKYRPLMPGKATGFLIK